MTGQIDQAVNEVLAQTEKNRHALALLLREQQEKQGHILALSANMGRTSGYKPTTSYMTTVSLSWVAEHVKFAKDLPLFKGKLHPGTGKIMVDKDTINNIQQRPPDWRRQLPMTLYLAGRKNHKFPPILAVAYQAWVYDIHHDFWDLDRRAMRDSVSVKSLDLRGLYCNLDFSETQFYALDGQHRLMAIIGLKNFLTEGLLAFKNTDGDHMKNKKSITKDDLLKEIQRLTEQDPGQFDNYLQSLMSERIGIEIIPAVTRGETLEESRFRLRRLFVDVNERAKPPTKSEIIQLDEDDAFRIVARRVMVDHELLRNRVEQKRPNLSETSPHYTTLQSLVEIARKYLGEHKHFESWKDPIFSESTLGYWHPDESDLDEGVEALRRYLSSFQKIQSHLSLIQGEDSAATFRKEDGNDNVLFRPIAQIALAEALGGLERKAGQNLDLLMEKLRRKEDQGQLKLRSFDAPWYGVLWDPVNNVMRRKVEYQRLCFRLFRYLLGGKIEYETDRIDLTRRFAKARATGEDSAYNYDGTVVSHEYVKLPDPW